MKKERKAKHFIKKPVYEGGPKALKRFIALQLQYPAEALAHQVEGTVALKYTIDHLGEVIDTQIISGVGYGCDEEAERLVRLLRFQVPPNRGLRVTFHKSIQIHFNLPVNSSFSVQYNYMSTSGVPAGSYHYTIDLEGPPSSD